MCLCISIRIIHSVTKEIFFSVSFLFLFPFEISHRINEETEVVVKIDVKEENDFILKYACKNIIIFYCFRFKTT